MNQSKISKLIATCFVISFLIVVFFQIDSYKPACTPDYFMHEGDGFTMLCCQCRGFSWDASNIYTPAIEGKKKVTDWHSALYMYECRVALRLAKTISSSFDGIKIQIIAYYVHLIALLICASLLMYRGILKNTCLALLFLPVCISMNYMFEWLPIGLDFFFFVHFSILCCGVAILPKIESKRLKIIAWVIIVITLFHAVNYRKNAILIVPFIAYIYIYCTQKTNKKIIALLGRYILLTITFSIVSLKIVGWMLPVIHTDPIAPMLSSDLRMAAVLRGEQEQYRKEIVRVGGSVNVLNNRYANSLTASYWGAELSRNGCLVPKAYDFYFAECYKYWKSVIVSRVIQTVEFYCGGVFPSGQKIIERLYPSLKTNPAAWQFARHVSKKVMWSRFGVLFAGVALICLILFKKMRKGKWCQPHDKPIALICAAAMVYVFSFAIVPPCASERYLAPSLFIIWNACWAWLAFTLCDIEKRKAQEDVFC